MDLGYLFWTGFKFILCLLCALLFYYVYDFIIKPWRVRRYYKQYPRVKMSENFVPFMGDFNEYMDNKKNDIAYYYHYKLEKWNLTNYDFKLIFEGNDPILSTVSNEAMEQMKDLIPSKIDRYPWKKGYGKIFMGSAMSKTSTPETMGRLKLFVKELSMNSSSKYIPIIVQAIEGIMSSWKEGQTQEGIIEMNYFTFTAFTMVLYGRDMEHVASKLMTYETSEGTSEELSLKDYFFEMINDISKSWIHPFTALFPFANNYDLINPYRRNRRNLDRFKDYLHELIDQTKDEESICNKILQKSNIDKRVLTEDFLGFMFAGAETASHCLTSCLYYLKKRPKTYEKLMEEITSKGFFKFEDKFTLEMIDDMDYLNYVIKEALRLDVPAMNSLPYMCNQDVEI
jgi:cytochrome P450